MNALVQVRWTLDVPEEALEKLVGRPDDGSDSWYREACQKAEDHVKDDLVGALDRYGNAYVPDVECDG